MRIASSVSKARFIVASTVLLAAGLAGSSSPRPSPCVRATPWSVVELPISGQQPEASVPGGPYRALEFSSMRVESLEPPRWFGARGHEPVRIAGKVWSAARDTTVRLALDVPEPGIWPGRVAAVAADGSFDFGPMIPGPYLVIAYGGDRVSRVTSIDTTRERGDSLELYAAPCRALHGSFWNTSDRRSSDATPAVGVAVELSGWVLGVTDATGTYQVCVPDDVDHSKLRVAGFADPPSVYHTDSNNHRLLWPRHLEEGIVFDIDGSPAAYIGVQPIWRVGTSECRAAKEVRTTDDSGRFMYNAANQLCGFRIWRGGVVHDQRYDGMRFHAPQIVMLPAAGDEIRLFDYAFDD